MFTLGFTLAHNDGSRVVDFVAAGTGLVLVALQIAYLPTLYSAYNRRETLVTLLESRAGSPAWGPELLIRHQLVGSIDNLPSLFAEWERWAADVAESHSTYPSLLYLRSPRAQNSWIVSLLAVMDAAALNLAIDPVGAPIEARMCIRMGFTCLRDIAQATRIPYDADPDPDEPIALAEAAFDEAYDRLVAVGMPTSRPGTRRGPTSEVGGSTTRPSPMPSPTGSTPPRPSGPVPDASSGASRWSRCARPTASRRRSRPGPAESPRSPSSGPTDLSPERKLPSSGGGPDAVQGGVSSGVPVLDDRLLALPAEDADRRGAEDHVAGR